MRQEFHIDWKRIRSSYFRATRLKILITAGITFAFAVTGILFVVLRPPAPSFLLIAGLEQRAPSAASLSLTIDLMNSSTRTQSVIVPTTNFFWGVVFCRGTKGLTNEFIHTNMLGRLMGANPIEWIDLAPGAFRRWRHPLADFVEFIPGTNSPTGSEQSPIYRFLDREFQKGSELWCEFEVAQESTYKTAKLLSSGKIKFPKQLQTNALLASSSAPLVRIATRAAATRFSTSIRP